MKVELFLFVFRSFLLLELIWEQFGAYIQDSQTGYTTANDGLNQPLPCQVFFL